MIFLEEIEIPNCYLGRLDRFNAWRRAIACNIGASIWYGFAEKDVAFDSPRLSQWPERLQFCTAMVTDETLRRTLTPEQRLGNWDSLPSEPLMIVVLLTVPGGVIRSAFAAAIAERLKEIDELIHYVDDGRFGTFDLTRFHHHMYLGMRSISHRQTDGVIIGQYPSGWWPGVVPKAG
jgi:hypothetical protein